MIAGLGWTPVLIGGLAAALSAALAVRFLLRHLSRHGLTAFAVYRLALAAALWWSFAP
jgi:undecaprenyl-diphosphatase